MKAEISYDLIMEDDMSFVEGTYRLPGQNWQVFIFAKEHVAQPEVTPGIWESGVSGVFVRIPWSTRLNQSEVERVLAENLDIVAWTVVRGPDSMQLR
ncbi:MAG: hypothetical protein L0215_23310 [Gemmataceae bacterium]|nr:hypothetical protein [Gemmataceae bacterium]